MIGAGIRHVLLDADGVLQSFPGDWREVARPWLGEDAEEFLREAWAAEKPALRGEGDFVESLAGIYRRRGGVGGIEELYAALWHGFRVDPESAALVRRLRTAGLGVHLGTNQHAQRAAYMRTTLGYDDLLDVGVYSCEIGVAKPDPAFFETAVALIDAEPAAIVFVDDVEANVESARSVGLVGIHWSLREGHDPLERRLCAAGIDLG